jgi:glutathione S-transferase
MLLYDSPISGNCFKVRLLLAHLGIEYERRDVEVVDRTAPRDFLAELNPAKRVPTVVLDDGRPLAESNAILWYFGEGTPFVPDDRYERAAVLQWMFFEQYEHEPAIAVARFLKTYYGKPEVWESQRDQLTKRGVKALRMLEAGLHDRDWLVGDRMTIADKAL